MNVSIIDPLQGDFPEVIEEFLEHGVMKCIAFNRRGTLLAAGCSDGSCIIWDFETRGIAKELRDADCVTPITSVCWSKYGHHVLVSAIDKSLTLWNIVNGEKIMRMTLQQTTLHARLHPGARTPSVCLACPLSSAPVLVDLNTGSTTVLPVSVSDTDTGVVPPRNKFLDGSPPLTPTSACFNKHGDLIYVGNSKGEILIIDYKNIQVYGIVPISGAAVIKNILFSRNGQYLLTNSNDRTIRVYENHLPQKDGAKALEEITKTFDELQGVEKLKAVGSKCLVLCREFQDSISKIHWKAPCFSGDGEWVVGASGSKGEHKIYIWDRAGHLVKILEGPKEALTDLSWHPVHPVVVSVSISGLVYIWAKDYTENWSAFAPDFKELEENEEYVEREDEFDLMPETEKVKHSHVNEDEDVDILTVEKDSAFSDSDMSEEELCFLPAVPSPDVPELQDKCVGSSSKLIDSNHSGSPLSDEAGQNGHAVNPESSPVEVVGNSIAEDTGATTGCMKRKRKLSEKGLELLQAEKGRKPLKKMNKTKASKNRNKPAEGQDRSICVSADDVTD
ncbi:WD40 repeat [Macleaya cordata]|uniref:WD40 repeat n=1 Tax=Macleaya cordata TaxID=56857 RepID=A0A200PS07_MACCD|nr:WD40 repeat [Macleaya cordata]